MVFMCAAEVTFSTVSAQVRSAAKVVVVSGCVLRRRASGDDGGNVTVAAHIKGMTNSAGPSRVSPGVPTGGQFAAQAHPDSGISLVAEAPVLTAVQADQHAEELIGRIVSMNYPDGKWAAYHPGVAEAFARTAATFITDDLDPSVTAARILAYSRESNADYVGEQPALIRRTCVEISGEPLTITAERAESEFVDAVDRAYAYHQECHPSVTGTDKSDSDWRSVGLRNGTAYAAARWANLTNPGVVEERSLDLQQALRDGVNVRHILQGAARGTHFRDSSGYWYDRRDPEAARLADLD